MNEMRKLMEAIEQIEEDAYEVNVDIVAKLREQLASAIADDIMTKINLTSENAQDVFNTISNYTEGYVSAIAKDLKQSAELALNDRLEVAVDSMDSVEEGKYDYPQGMKGKGAAYKEIKGSGNRGNANRKSRKAFRKAQKAKAHAARMRGEVTENDDDEWNPTGPDPMCDNCAGDGTIDIGGKTYNCPECNSGISEAPEDEILGEDSNENREIAEQLHDIKEEIKDLMENARNLLRGTVADDSANSYWVPHILMALDDEHDWLGGSMHSLQDSIDQLLGDNEEEDVVGPGRRRRANR